MQIITYSSCSSFKNGAISLASEVKCAGKKLYIEAFMSHDLKQHWKEKGFIAFKKKAKPSVDLNSLI